MISLGSLVCDNITGFEGIAVSRTEYLFGCARMGVQPEGLTQNNKPFDEEYFDEHRLELLEDRSPKVAKHMTQEIKPPGGPGNVPPKREIP